MEIGEKGEEKGESQMQEHKDDEVIKTVTGSLTDVTKMITDNASRYVVTRLPRPGEEIIIKGLIWVVERVNSRHGWMRLRLKEF